MSEDMPWVIGLTDEEVQELRTKKQELTEYGKQKLRELMNKKPTLRDVIDQWYLDSVTDNIDLDVPTCVEDLVSRIEEWLPPEHDSNDYQWNKCIKMMKENLR
jgi:DNA-binding PadR family transcriptional regulator